MIFWKLSYFTRAVSPAFKRVYIEAVGTYPLAERCPFLIAELAA